MILWEYVDDSYWADPIMWIIGLLAVVALLFDEIWRSGR